MWFSLVPQKGFLVCVDWRTKVTKSALKSSGCMGINEHLFDALQVCKQGREVSGFLFQLVV